MSWFRKKKNEEPAPAAEPVKSWCERTGKHLYEDLPWYLLYYYNADEHQSEFEIHEVYVCHLCHDVKDVLLSSYTMAANSLKQHNSNLESMEEKYGAYLKPHAVVMDMVQDMINLDKERLKIWKEIHPAGTVEI